MALVQGGETPNAAAQRAPLDDLCLSMWAADVRARGWSLASTSRAVRQLRAFGRGVPGGLLAAEPKDVRAFGATRGYLLDGGRRAAADHAATSPGWTGFLDAAGQFYFWLERGGRIPAGTSLVQSLRRAPRRVEDSRAYDEILSNTGLGERDQIVLRLLGHGLAPAEVVRLTPQDVRVADAFVIVNADRPGLLRVVPIATRSMAIIGPWSRIQAIKARDFLVEGATGRALSTRTIRSIVQRAAEMTFPNRPRTARSVSASGFRSLFIARAVARGLPPHAVRALTGVGVRQLALLLDRHCAWDETLSAFATLTSRWRRWL